MTRLPSGPTRRELLGGLAAAALAPPAARAIHAVDAGEAGTPARHAPAAAAKLDPALERAYEVRVAAARLARDAGSAAQRSNGDEERLPARIAAFSKGLPHDAAGRVDEKSYAVLLAALRSGAPEDFERVPLGGFAKLANPQAAWAIGLVGPDPSQLACPPAPAFDGAEQGAELIELWWQALLRDVPFTAYESHPLVRSACDELSRLPAFTGPRLGGAVTPATLFRGATEGDLAGPYLSQFLAKPIPLVPTIVEQKNRTAVPGLDYMTERAGWLAIQNGGLSGVNQFEAKPLFPRNGRDLGEYVHRDFSYQPYLAAALQAIKWGTLPDGGNPYKHSRTQSAFATFGPPYLLALLATVTQACLAVCWYQKWRVHRRLRPEEMAGRVEIARGGPDEASALLASHLPPGLLDSAALAEVTKRAGTALLPQAYPEGCPIHPSYPAGHAVIAGACVTAIKACLDESHVVPAPVVPTPDGLALEPYQGPPLSIGGELDKLASNVSLGRDFAGIHWRSDAAAGLRLGEEVAIRVLAEMKLTGNEIFESWSLRRFDGRRVSV